jgi:hypothetical protein
VMLADGRQLEPEALLLGPTRRPPRVPAAGPWERLSPRRWRCGGDTSSATESAVTGILIATSVRVRRANCQMAEGERDRGG